MLYYQCFLGIYLPVLLITRFMVFSLFLVAYACLTQNVNDSAEMDQHECPRSF